jgi:O-antigen/teichoic acid export membrane protein
MNSLPRPRAETNWAIVANASSLLGASALTSGLGFVYWWLAARQFPPEAVGFASASVSAMTLLGMVSMLGLGTLLIGEFPRRPGDEASLIATALVLAGVAGSGLGLSFAVVAPHISPDLQLLSAGWENAALFALGVGLTAVALVLDHALIGLLRGDLQFGRNVLIALAKLGALAIAGTWLAEPEGLTIYATWVAGNLVSLAGLAGFAAWRGGVTSAWRPQWRILPGLSRVAARHHPLNMALQAPHLALPVLVTALLSASVNAYFYIAWMLASFVFVGPVALATVLYAVGARAPTALAHRIRLTLGLSLLIGVLANGAVLFASDWVLAVFGAAYSERVGGNLRILCLAIFPLIIKDHYVAVCRVYGQLKRGTVLVAAGGLLELIMAAIGASIGGLSGLCVGWVAAVCVEATCMAARVYRAAAPAGAPEHQTSEGRPSSATGTAAATGALMRLVLKQDDWRGEEPRLGPSRRGGLR